jgi:TP901 family phage tail tape measure protein
MAERQVSVRLSAKIDGYVSAMNQAAAASNMFGRQTEASLRSMGTGIRNAGRAMTLGLTAPIAALGVASTNMAKDFQQSFTRMVGLAEVPASEVGRLQEAVKGLAGETGRAPQELADGLYQAASSGLTAAEALEATTLAGRAAAVGMGQTKDVTGLIAAATAAYGRENITATETVDMLTMAIREGRAEPDEMAHALGRVIPVAAAMGIGFDQVAGTVAYLSNIMGDTDITVTSLRDALVKLNNPTVQGRETLLAMGTSVEELRATIADGGILGAFDLLREHGFDQNTEAVQRLFADVQGQQAAFALLDDSSGALATTLGKTADATGAFSEAWQGWLGSDAAKVDQAMGQIKVGMMEIGEVLLPLAGDVLGFGADIASAFAGLPEPVQQATVAFLGLVAVAGPLTWMAGSVIRNLTMIRAAAAALAGIQLPSWLAGSGAGAGASVTGPIGLLLAANTMGAGAHVRQAERLEAGQGFQAGIDLGNNTSTPQRGANWGDSTAERFGNRLLGRELPTGTVGTGVRLQTGTEGLLADALSGGTPLNTRIPDSISSEGTIHGIRAQVAALREAGEAALIYEGRLVQGAEAVDMLDNFAGRLASEQDNYNRVANEGISIAAQQYEAYQRQGQAAQAYRDVLASPEWGQTGITAASMALGTFNEYLFGGYTQIATTEAAVDGLATALEDVGTIGAGGLADLNLKTEEGRVAFQALQQVAGAFEPQVASAVAAANGSVETLQGTLGGLRDGFIETAVAAGIPRAEAENLATAIGLIPENAQTLIDLQGAEDAQLKLSLMQTAIGLLEEKDQTSIALLIADGQFQAAADLAQSKLTTLDQTNATPTITAVDNATGTISTVQSMLNALRDKTITITTTHVANYVTHVLSGGAPNVAGGRILNSAAGRYIDQFAVSTLAESGPEVVLPLTDAGRMRELVADPRVAGPLFSALGLQGAPTSGGQSVTYVANINGPIYGVDDVKATINQAFRERDARARAGSRHR